MRGRQLPRKGHARGGPTCPSFSHQAVLWAPAWAHVCTGSWGCVELDTGAYVAMGAGGGDRHRRSKYYVAHYVAHYVACLKGGMAPWGLERVCFRQGAREDI